MNYSCVLRSSGMSKKKVEATPRGRGRPVSENAKRITLNVRLDAETSAGLEAYRAKYDLEDDSAAARHALRAAFRGAGISVEN